MEPEEDQLPPVAPVAPVLTNHNGLLFDTMGVVRGIEISISDEPVTGFSRIARHEGLSINANMQMTQRVRVVKLNAEGMELTNAVLDQSLNANVQSQLLNAYQDTFYSANTEGALVTPMGIATEDPTGSIEQLRFFQGISIGILKAMGQPITDATSVPMLVYILILGEIIKLDEAGRL